MDSKENSGKNVRLLPALREGVEMVKLVAFKNLAADFQKKFPGQERTHNNRLAAAVINSIFGPENQDENFKLFVRDNLEPIDRKLKNFANEHKELLIPVSDALRVQFMCDCQEGNEDASWLKKAQEVGILLVERDLPMPGSFLTLVAKLGTAMGLINPPPKDS